MKIKNEKVIRVTISNVGLSLSNTFFEYSDLSDEIVSIPVSNIPNGIYLAAIETDLNNSIHKIICKKLLIAN